MLVLVSLALLVTCSLMARAPMPSAPGIDTEAAFGSTVCESSFGTEYDC
jgi:hypothetical protein